jgi:hypothetical protein
MQIKTDRNGGISSSRWNGTVDDVERNIKGADLAYDGLLDCFSRKWRLVITGDYKDYETSSLPLNGRV